ncbi:MAG: ribosome biogenesis GTPase YlqF [Bacilli bacterium]|nr:ribosome biogenesis GTPase YlqF [Bacilli bacterium]
MNKEVIKMDMYQKRKMRQEKKNNDSQKSFSKVSISWYPGHMAKTKREIKEKIDLIDIVFEVVDARIPYSSKNKEIEEMTKGKPRVIVMTKIDLCDSGKTNKWIKYYEDKDYIVIPIDLINNPNTKIIFDKIKPLVDEINNKRKSKGLKERKARILIMGVPNVGKSTLINRLVGRKATNVGNRPGVTKNLEWIRINEKVELLDTPGILWPKLDEEEVAYNLASMTAIKEEVLDSEDIAIYIIKKLLSDYPDNIINRYSLTKIEDIVDILDEIGKKIGAFRNSETDYDRVYKRVIKDLQDGYLGKITFDNIN